MKFPIKLSTFLLLTTAPVVAEELIVLDEIIVTAGYKDSSLNETGANVSILKESELQHATTGLVQTFENVPGVSVSFSGGMGAQTSISIRGLDQDYVAVRLDGMDITDPTATQVSYDFGGIIGSGLDQVEFVKGSQSAIFGSEAVGGVVNLKTLSSNEKGSRGKFSAEGGTHDTYSSSLNYEKVTNDTSAALAISRLDTKGFSASKVYGANEPDPYKGNQARIALTHSVNNNATLSFGILNSSETIKYDSQWTALTDSVDRNTTTFRLGSNFGFGDITHDVSLQKGNFERVYSYGTYEGNRTEFEYKGQTFVGSTSLTFGAVQSEETYEETIFASMFGPQTINTFDDKKQSIFLEANQYLIDKLNISVSARNTRSDDFKTNTSYRIASVYELNSDTIFRALFGSGYRAASLFERYDPNYGGGDFELEESQTLEVGIEKSFGNDASTRIAVFDTKVDNLIQFNKNLGAFGLYEQPGITRRSKGAEISGSLKVGENTSLKGSYTYTSAKNGSVAAARVPNHDIGLSALTEFGQKINARIQINHINGYKDEDDNGVVFDMPNYTVINTNLNYEISSNLEGYVRVQNLMGSDYETIKDFNTGGRQIFAGVRATF